MAIGRDRVSYSMYVNTSVQGPCLVTAQLPKPSRLAEHMLNDFHTVDMMQADGQNSQVGLQLCQGQEIAVLEESRQVKACHRVQRCLFTQLACIQV